MFQPILILAKTYCNLIGYATRYLFVNRYRVAASNATRPSFSQRKNCLFLVFRNNCEKITNISLFFIKIIRLLALNFYEAIVNLSFTLVNYHLGNFELVI